MKKQSIPLTAEEQYPELKIEARYIELTALQMITQAKRKLLRANKTTCPYPAQCMLEMLVKNLQEAI